jgi:drug/metabolite transporter (DMT)-like permease
VPIADRNRSRGVHASPRDITSLLAIGALLVGATAIGSSALFVRVSETGPIATAFWRIFIALPFLWTWSLTMQRGRHAASFKTQGRLLAAAGFFFAADLSVWHWSIRLTSIANATLLVNLAPVLVALAAWLWLRERLSIGIVCSLLLALAGMGALIGGDFELSHGMVLGDVLGVVTAFFYAGYQLTVFRLRASVATASVMAWSGLVSAALLLPAAVVAHERILPVSSTGWLTLISLALISQVAGQSLIAYAMAHLSATFSSIGLLLQPVAAALFAWLWLNEAMGPLQIAGGLTVLIAIALTHGSRTRRGTASAEDRGGV